MAPSLRLQRAPPSGCNTLERTEGTATRRMVAPQAGDIRTAIGSGLLHLGVSPKAMVGLYSVNCKGGAMHGCVHMGVFR
jgi:hypothetical protein